MERLMEHPTLRVNTRFGEAVIHFNGDSAKVRLEDCTINRVEFKTAMINAELSTSGEWSAGDVRNGYFNRKDWTKKLTFEQEQRNTRLIFEEVREVLSKSSSLVLQSELFNAIGQLNSLQDKDKQLRKEFENLSQQIREAKQEVDRLEKEVKNQES